MIKMDIDRICAATLLGRFGPGLIPARSGDDINGATAAGTGATGKAAATLWDVAVWTTATTGSSKGKR